MSNVGLGFDSAKMLDVTQDFKGYLTCIITLLGSKVMAILPDQVVVLYRGVSSIRI